WRYQEMRGNLANVFLHRLGTLRTVDAKTYDQRCSQGPESIADPGRREIGQRLIRAPIGLNLQHALDARNQVGMRQHGAFWRSCRPGGVTHEGHVVWLPSCHQLVK